jgi:hypothetical protein
MKAGRGRDAVALLDKVVATRPSDDNVTLALFSTGEPMISQKPKGC